MPVVGEKTSGFGAQRRGGWHSGVDLRAPAGTPVQAAAAGVIVHARVYYAYGIMVEIEHPDGTRSRYAHLARVARGLVVGQWVEAGTVIGAVGRTGKASGFHLHVELRRHGRAVDPWPWLTGASCLPDYEESPEATSVGYP